MLPNQSTALFKYLNRYAFASKFVGCVTVRRVITVCVCDVRWTN